MVSKEGRDCEATKDNTGRDQGLEDQSGVQNDGHVQEGTHRETRAGRESKEVSKSSVPVLASVRGRPEGESESKKSEGREETTRDNVGVEMKVSSCRGRQESHTHSTVDILEVLLNRGLQLPVEAVDKGIDSKGSHLYLRECSSGVCTRGQLVILS